MKLLGIDFGTKRVGLAVTDPAGSMAFPLSTLERGGQNAGRDALFRSLVRVVADEGVEGVVVGYPAPSDGGQESLTARQAVNFARSMARRVAVPVWLMDETLSSHAAEADLREAGLKRSKQRQALDQQAAVRILESYLAAPETARAVTADNAPGPQAKSPGEGAA